MDLTPRQTKLLAGAYADLRHYATLPPRYRHGDPELVRERTAINHAQLGLVRTDPARWLSEPMTASLSVLASRDLKSLEAAGLLERHCLGAAGDRTTHLRLTLEGERLAASMTTETVHP